MASTIRSRFSKESESNDFTVIDSNASIDDQQPFVLDKRTIQRIREQRVEHETSKQEAAFVTLEDHRVWIGTWNVNGQLARDDVTKWIHGTSELNTDMYVLGFEEMVPLNPWTILFERGVELRREKWIKLVLEVLRSIRQMQFICLSSVSMVGLFLAVFVPLSKRYLYSNISTGKVATGMYGFTGNKGAVSIRLHIHSSPFVFICSHLTPHPWYITERNHDFHKIWDELLFDDKPLSPTDSIIWMGDLNYRLDSSLPTETLFKAARYDYHHLIQFDQLHLVQQQHLAFSGFLESIITFPPTYKFLKGSNEYDTRPRKEIREPAWCDRILFTSQSSDRSWIQSERYDSYQEVNSSDHKPVYSIMTITSKHINKQIQMMIEAEERTEILQYDEGTPSVSLSNHILDFGDVMTKQRVNKQVSIVNTSESNAYLSFLSQEAGVCKEWFSVTPTEFMLLPHEEKTVDIEVCVSPKQARMIRKGYDVVKDVLFLQVSSVDVYPIFLNVNLCSKNIRIPSKFSHRLLLVGCLVCALLLDTYQRYA